MSRIKERVLLKGVCNLNPQALARVHNTYYPAILRYISYKVGDYQTAEDLASEVFVRLLDAVHQSNPPRKTLRGWLYGTASNIINDHFRTHYKNNHRLELKENIDSKILEPSEQLVKKQAIQALQEALNELTDAQRNVIEFRFGFQMPIKEVARRIGKSEGAVKQLQARGLDALSRKMMTKYAALTFPDF